MPDTYSGGIVTHPQVRSLAERGPEAVIPLSKVPAIFSAILNSSGAASSMGVGTGGGKIEVNFNNPVVRDDRDLQRIIDAVEKALSAKILRQAAYGGAVSF